MFEAFKIGIELFGINGASGVIGAVTRDIMKLSRELEATNSKFKGLTSTMELGFAGILGGGAILGGLYKIQEAGREQAHIQQELITSGLKQAEVAQMVGEAWSLAQTKRDFTSDQYLEMLVESRGALPNIPALMKAAPQLADFATDVKLGDSGADPKGMIQDAIKLAAIRGHLYKPGTRELDEAGFKDELDWMGRATRFTHGQLNPHNLRQNAMQAGPIARSMTPEAFYGWGAEVQNTMGSSKAGTALGSMATQLMGGVMPKYVAEHLEAVGWLNAKKVHFQGAHASLDEGALADGKGFGANPYDWLWKHIKDAAKKDHRPEQDEVFRLFGRQTSMRLGSDVDANVGELQNAFDQQKKAWGASDTAAQARKADPDAIMRSFTASWTDLVKALGTPMVGPANDMLIKVTGTVRDMTAWANANQDKVLYLERAAAIIGGLFVVGGTVAILGAGLTLLSAAFAPFAIGAIAMGAIVFLYGPQGLRAVADSFEILKRAVQDFVGWFHGQNFSLGNVADGAKSFFGLGNGDGENDLSRRLHAQMSGTGLTDVTSKLAPSGATIQTKTTVNLDGKKVAEVVTEHQADAMSGSSDGMTGFDRRATPVFPGALIGAY